MFVRRADEGYCIGPATYTTPDGTRRAGYLDYEAVERALVSTGAGGCLGRLGFVAEHPDFAALCERLGVVFVGPSSETMRLLGDKIRSKRIAEEAGSPWRHGAAGPWRPSTRPPPTPRPSATRS